MNKILAFDVSSGSCSVAVSKGQDILSLKEEHSPSMQAEKLLPLIELALEDSSFSYNDLDYIAATNGPGSFTGIRIGLATAKGLCLGSSAKEMAITNFEFYHYRAKEQVARYNKIIVLINAYRDQLYFQEFDHMGNHSEPALYDIHEVIDILNKQPTDCVVVGNGLSVVYHQIKDMANLRILPRFPKIKAVHLCRLADELINANKISPVSPLYIRPPDAKVPGKN